MSFRWHPDEKPPQIEAHSKAKLRVLRRYLRAYFDRLNVNPHREEFKLDLVDGFAGGGLFSDGNDLVPGSPMVMLEEAEEAKVRLNRRRTKPLAVDCQFYFVDREKAHTDHLRRTLTQHGHVDNGDKIVVRTGLFENEIDDILKSIHQRQPRSGRAIFLLDQTGFAQVKLGLVARIFDELPAAEVILTFAADSLINFLSERPQMVTAARPVGLSEEQIRRLIEEKNEYGGKALVQRTLRDHARFLTGATYDTPFFIRPEQSRRALWFLHLSRHPTARDVMIQRHWDIQNTFEHCGIGSFGMLGWDALLEDGTRSLFRFQDLDRQQMHKELLNELPRELFSLVSEEPVTIETFRHMFANRTAARFSDLDEVVLQLFREKEFAVLDQDGKERSRALKRLKTSDRIALPSTLLLPGLSRLF